MLAEPIHLVLLKCLTLADQIYMSAQEKCYWPNNFFYNFSNIQLPCAISYLNMNGVELVADLLTSRAGGQLVHWRQASTKSEPKAWSIEDNSGIKHGDLNDRSGTADDDDLKWW